MRRGDFLLALLSSRLVLMIIEIGLLLTLGVIVFHMKVLGSIFAIVLLGSLGAVCFGGIGLLTASRAQKIESVSGLMNLVMMPMWIFSGVFFSYERFPAVIQPLDQGAAADCFERCAAGEHSGRHAADPSMAAAAGDGCVGWDLVRAGAEVVPVDLGGGVRLAVVGRRSMLQTPSSPKVPDLLQTTSCRTPRWIPLYCPSGRFRLR